MSIKESALSAITSITQSDFVRAVTAAGASRRVTVANLAKAIIESYTGSSLAGKNQSVQAALDALNSKTGRVTLYSVNVSSEAQANLVGGTSARAMLVTSGPASNSRGVWLLNCTTTAMSATPVLPAEGVTIQFEGKNGTLTNNSGYQLSALLINFGLSNDITF